MLSGIPLPRSQAAALRRTYGDAVNYTDWQDSLLTCDEPGCPGTAAPYPGIRPADHTCALARMTADGRPGRGNPMEGLPGTGTQEDDPT